MAFNINPMQLMQLIKRGGNPQQLIIGLMEQQAGSNPLMNNLLNLAKQGKTGDIESIARNMLKEQGKDYDKEFTNFKQKFGL